MASTINVDQFNNAAGTTGFSLDSNGKAQIPGHVMQVVNSGSIADHTNSAGGTWSDTNATVDITPTSTSNKILISAHIYVRVAGTGAIKRGAIRLIRTVNSTDTTVWNTTGMTEQIQERTTAISNGETSGCLSFEYLDSPSTTDTVTYTIQSLKSGDSGTSNFITWGNQRGTNIVLKEVAG